jgi:hypothetical protein
MHEIELVAQQEGCQAIRLDAYDKHVKLVEWYQHLGYQWRGAFSFRTKIYGETGMICLEKINTHYFGNPYPKSSSSYRFTND